MEQKEGLEKLVSELRRALDLGVKVRAVLLCVRVESTPQSPAIHSSFQPKDCQQWKIQLVSEIHKFISLYSEQAASESSCVGLQHLKTRIWGSELFKIKASFMRYKEQDSSPGAP